jgi:hypothetical protein
LHHPAGPRITIFPSFCGPLADATLIIISNTNPATLFSLLSATWSGVVAKPDPPRGIPLAESCVMTIDKETEANLRFGTPTLTAARDKYTLQVTLLKQEDRKLQGLFCEKMLRDLAPEGELELQLAYSIAQDTWTCNRFSVVQQNLLHLKHDTVLDHLIALDQRIHMNAAQLRKMQAARRAERDKRLDKAAALAQLNLSKGQTYNPDYDFAPEAGFTFSMHEIQARIDRNARLRDAKALERALAREASKNLRKLP